MRAENEIVREIDAAQADLEQQVAAVKDLVDDVLARPKRAIRAARKPRELFVEHPVIVIACAVMLGVLVGVLRRRRVLMY